jgi:predicted NBD/HSP70 family sugar kinase
MEEFLMKAPLKVLVIDIGGTNVKFLATGQKEARQFPSGKGLTPDGMIAGVKKLTKGWAYDVVSIGYPGPVREGRPAVEPRNLARGWVGFDFQAAFGCRIGDNANAFVGGFRLWEKKGKQS